MDRELAYRRAFDDFSRAVRCEGESVYVVDPDYHADRRHLLFVYGTMKHGFRNHDRIAGRGRFIAKTRTREKCFQMFVKTRPYTAPCVIHRAETGLRFSITGELYQVDGPLLETVDIHEGHPTTYMRERVMLDDCFGLAWMYVYQGRLRTHADRETEIDFNAMTQTFTLTE